MTVDVTTLAARLDDAARQGTPVPPLTEQAALSVADAYRVQQELLARRTGRGERLTGVKMGLTSQAKMTQMGVDQPVWGRLTDAMAVPDGGTVTRGRYIHPRVEPEIAVRFGAGGEPTAVAAALELIDSRYVDFRFALPDVVADDTSAAGYVVGPWQPLPAAEEGSPLTTRAGTGGPSSALASLGVLLEVDGRVMQTGAGAAILGDPWRALASGRALMAQAGLVPEPGWVFLAGAATAAVPLAPGAHVRAVVERLGTAELTAATEATTATSAGDGEEVRQ